MARFSKRHYEMVAQAMQESSPSRPHRNSTSNYSTALALYNIRREQWEMTRDQLSNVFRGDNAAFKSERFIRACEYGANVKARS